MMRGPATTGKRCVRCCCPIDESNDSDEHVIPNSIGGHLKVRGFICVGCNNKTGETWDRKLSDELNFFCLFFGIVRDRGEPRPEPIETTAGEKLLMQPGGGFKKQRPTYQEVDAERGKRIRIEARTFSEAKQMLEGVARKYAQVDVVAELEKASSNYGYPEGVVVHSPTVGGPLSGRSIVKTAIAYAHYAGIPAGLCDLGVIYLRDEAAPPSYGFYSERDLVAGRPSGIPIHCVAVSANPETGLLLGYVEYFGVHRMVLCLSQSYSGPVVDCAHAIDPLTGRSIPVRVTLPFTAADVESIYAYERVPSDGVQRAFAEVFPTGLKLGFEREKARVIKDAVRYAFENCGAKPGDMLTDEQKAKLPGLVTERMMPFIRRHAARR